MASKKQQIQPAWTRPMLLSAVFLVVSYALISLAIERGSIFAYILAFVTFYYFLHHSIDTVKKCVINDKPTKARRSKKSNSKK